MKNKKKQAIDLRKRGNSYNQINEKLNIPKSTLSYWLKDIKLSKSAKEKISKRAYNKSVEALIKRNIKQTSLAEKRALFIREQAKSETKSLINDKLFLTGISLYWAEGYKKGAEGSKWKVVDFANSDSEMIKIMIDFFKKVCQVPKNKIKIQLMTHPNIDAEKASRYWSNITKIPNQQFIKTCYSISRHSQGKRNKKSLPHGTIHIRVHDVKLFFRIIGWIDGLKVYFK